MLNYLSDLNKLNTLTKYPSIQTYHRLEKGVPTPEITSRFQPGEDIFITEKIDGTNGRIVLLPDGEYLIGSREELLAYSRDALYSPALGIVDVLRPIAKELARIKPEVQVFYFEVYGGNIGRAAKQYSGEGRTIARCFDSQSINPEKWKELTDLSIEKIAAWRESNSQQWLKIEELRQFDLGIVPWMGMVTEEALPRAREDAKKWLDHFEQQGTMAGIDGTGLGGTEGIVIRNNDRSQIAKIRVEDYRKWAKKHA